MKEGVRLWTTRGAAALSLVAAALHAALVDEHLKEWWGYGLFFILASVAQGIYGLVLFALPQAPPWNPAQWRMWRIRLFLAGIIGNGAILLLYLVTRTIGIPLAGPEAGEVEDVAAIDIVTKSAELIVVMLLAFLVAAVWREPPAATP